MSDLIDRQQEAIDAIVAWPAAEIPTDLIDRLCDLPFEQLFSYEEIKKMIERRE